MTSKELSQLYWLSRELEVNKERLTKIAADIEQVEAELADFRANIDGVASPSLEGMPHGSEVRSPVESAVGRLLALEQTLVYKREALINLRVMIEAQQANVQYELARLQTYISTIEDSFTRQVFVYRFMDGLRWKQVAEKLGDDRIGESVKHLCYRYIRTH